MPRPTPAEGIATRAAPGTIQVTMLSGPAALELLRDEGFRAEWKLLLRQCPWATVFQGVEFADAWWDVYATDYDPVVLAGRCDDGPMLGLMQLARNRTTGELLHVGTHHAEYHAWLAQPFASDEFMLSAVRLLHRQRACRVLRFQYLAPGAPIGWTQTLSEWLAPGVIVHAHKRGVRVLDTVSGENRSLRKRSNRSKMQRLGRAAPVEFRVLSSHEELDQWMPQIKTQCDARHGGETGIGPFARDPKKEQFFNHLLDTPHLMHAAVLVRGEQLLASHLGLIDGPSISLGLFTHDLEEQANSPGKLLLHMLAARLASDGFQSLDLTPGDDYKLRFATRTDFVHTLEVRFRPLDLVFRRLTSSRDAETGSTEASDPRKRALFVCYFFPPLLSSGTARSVEFARRLPDLGWEIQVLTVRESRDPWEKGRGGAVPDNVSVSRSTELPLAHALDLLHAVWVRILALFGLQVTGHPLRAIFAFPDPQMAWQSTWPGIRDGRNCDVIYASCSPFSSALSARLISLILRKPLVLDFRDPWTVNPYMRIGGVRRSLTRVVERWCISGARVVLLNSAGTERLYRKAYPEYEARFRTLPNGFDRLTPVESAAGDVFRILHIGSFYGPRRPDLLLEALAELIAEGHMLREQVEFVQVGEKWPGFAPFAQRVPISEVPPVPREQALDLMSTASLLYLKQGWEEGISDYVSVAAKTYEYLATGLPVLAECPPGDNLDIVREYSERQYLVESQSLADMKASLLNAFEDRTLPPGRVAPQFIDRFSRDNLSRRLSDILSAVTVAET